MKNKKPWLAAILNFSLWGLGYLYLGKKKKFAVILIIGSLIMFPNFFYDPGPAMNVIINLSGKISSIIISVAFAYDAYKEAER